MKTVENIQQAAPATQQPVALSGMKHRLICSAPGVAMTLMFGCIALTLGHALNFLPIVASLMVAAIGFVAPTILTEGWNKPFPSASHLALISARTKRRLWYLAALCFVIPPLVRLASKL